MVVQALSGSDGFLSPARLKVYNTMRNDPCSPKAVSTLSAYLHFGHISGQRVALEASKHRKNFKVFLLDQLLYKDTCRPEMYSCLLKPPTVTLQHVCKSWKHCAFIYDVGSVQASGTWERFMGAHGWIVSGQAGRMLRPVLALVSSGSLQGRRLPEETKARTALSM